LAWCWASGAVALVLVFSFAMSWMWTALAFKLQTPEAVMQLSMTVMFPLAFASNIFVDPATMPSWVQAVVNVNPVTHLTTAARGLAHGAPDGGPVLVVLAWSLGLVAVFGPLTMRLFARER
jgi:ABC-2 type transport system permease protein